MGLLKQSPGSAALRLSLSVLMSVDLKEVQKINENFFFRRGVKCRARSPLTKKKHAPPPRKDKGPCMIIEERKGDNLFYVLFY